MTQNESENVRKSMKKGFFIYAFLLLGASTYTSWYERSLLSSHPIIILLFFFGYEAFLNRRSRRRNGQEKACLAASQFGFV